MKNLFSTAVTESSHQDLEGVGSIRIEADGKMYRWVKNTSTSVTFVAGDAAFHALTDLGDAPKQIGQCATADLGFMAGITASTTIAASTGTNPKIYGWIQIFGYCSSINVLGHKTSLMTVGHSMMGVNAVGYLAYGLAMGTAALYRRLVILQSNMALMTTPVSTFVAGYIHCI